MSFQPPLGPARDTDDHPGPVAPGTEASHLTIDLSSRDLAFIRSTSRPTISLTSPLDYPPQLWQEASQAPSLAQGRQLPGRQLAHSARADLNAQLALQQALHQESLFHRSDWEVDAAVSSTAIVPSMAGRPESAGRFQALSDAVQSMAHEVALSPPPRTLNGKARASRGGSTSRGLPGPPLAVDDSDTFNQYTSREMRQLGNPFFERGSSADDGGALSAPRPAGGSPTPLALAPSPEDVPRPRPGGGGLPPTVSTLAEDDPMEGSASSLALAQPAGRQPPGTHRSPGSTLYPRDARGRGATFNLAAPPGDHLSDHAIDQSAFYENPNPDLWQPRCGPSPTTAYDDAKSDAGSEGPDQKVPPSRAGGRPGPRRSSRSGGAPGEAPDPFPSLGEQRQRCLTTPGGRFQRYDGFYEDHNPNVLPPEYFEQVSPGRSQPGYPVPEGEAGPLGLGGDPAGRGLGVPRTLADLQVELFGSAGGGAPPPLPAAEALRNGSAGVWMLMPAMWLFWALDDLVWTRAMNLRCLWTEEARRPDV
ncbi:hypothetical protein H696_02397 [Fonticula alba]|uniref:Uncharacterized protein n=1 Tax=Fonticula alba TaxID=691883 RepID=A0A058ZAK6_FONAL|nr:hypothetical protein H696_02397 [Fonticula alba]KCV71450.1 hypothetical protein H696_02397 [Fonticula alba]|eukprot:XP_009494573.1 hypothetical protein H696_02397 [Fonticula alba]